MNRSFLFKFINLVIINNDSQKLKSKIKLLFYKKNCKLNENRKNK